MCVLIHESYILTQQGTVYHAHMKTSTVQLPVDEYFKKSRLDIIPDLQYSYFDTNTADTHTSQLAEFV